ncbi:MAG: hypothetical protein AAGI15_14780, partial [Pseudomonadota bacterium]
MAHSLTLAPAARARRALAPWLGGLLTAAAAWYASAIGISQNSVIALWPAAGISLFLCWHQGRAALLPNLLAYISISLLLFDAPKVAAALGNTLGAALGALLLSRKLREPGIAPV